MATSPRPSDNTSFLTYMVGQRAKSGRGLEALDRAMGADKLAPQQQTQSASQPSETAAAPPTAPEPPTPPPMVLNGPNMVRNQPGPLVMSDTERYYRMMGRLPTAMELSVEGFTQHFKASTGRVPTRDETVAHLFRRPEMLQTTKDFEVAG